MSYLVTNALICVIFLGAIVLLITIRTFLISFNNSLYTRILTLYLIIAYLYYLNYLVLSPISVALPNLIGSDFVGAVG